MKVFLAVLAIAHAGASPAVGKDTVGRVLGHDLHMNLGHEVEVVRPQRAGDPELRIGGMAPLLALGIDGDPIGVSVIHVLLGRVRIGAGHHVHALLVKRHI